MKFFLLLLATLSFLFLTTYNATAQEASATHVGGYGEMTYTDPDGLTPGRLDIPRFVIFLSHQFSDKWSVKSETEIEHVRVEPGAPGGELEVEQAFLDFHYSKGFGLRGGLILIPAGIINQTHEPTTFLSVERPHVDLDVIPSTWRELGIGAYGDIGEHVKYQAEVTEGLNAAGFSTAGISEGRQEGVFSNPTSPGISAKLDFLPSNGLRIGASFYYQTNTATALSFQDSARLGQPISSSLVVAALDVRYDIGNAHLRGEIALDNVSHTSDLPQGVYSHVSGEYAEASYNVMSLISDASDAELLPFVRYEVESRGPILNPSWLIAGAALRPVDGVIVKLDYEWSMNIPTTSPGAKTRDGLFGFGLGFSF